MAVFKNPEHFNIGGDKTVTVTVTFDVGEKVNDETIMVNAADYLKYLANTKAHKAWGRTIEISDE
jgi:hypothetical protein